MFMYRHTDRAPPRTHRTDWMDSLLCGFGHFCTGNLPVPLKHKNRAFIVVLFSSCLANSRTYLYTYHRRVPRHQHESWLEPNDIYIYIRLHNLNKRWMEHLTIFPNNNKHASSARTHARDRSVLINKSQLMWCVVFWVLTDEWRR